MSTLWIKEHAKKPQLTGGPDIWSEPVLVEQVVSYTATAGQSAAFNAQTKFITITSDGIFGYLVAANPTAVAGTSFRVGTDQILTIAVEPPPGTAPYKISAVTTT
jgi:hypothetical protein